MNYVPTYDKSDDKADNEQLDTTDMPDLESGVPCIDQKS